MEDHSSYKITRRDFLKFLGSGALALGLGATVSRLASLPGSASANTSFSQNLAENVNVTDSADVGTWKLGVNLKSVPIHAALLPNGKILYISGSADVQAAAGGPFPAGVLDPVKNTQITMTTAQDIFCLGNCLLPSGKVLLTGGTLLYGPLSPNGEFTGLNCAYEFDSTSNSFTQVSSMAHGRWYPTNVVLPNGTVVTVSGFDEYGCGNGLAEIYDPNSQTFSISYDPSSNRKYCVGACLPSGPGSPCYGGTKQGTAPAFSLYPRMLLMPNGLVACVGQTKPLATWNPSTGQWLLSGNFAIGKDRHYSSAVLLPLQNSTTETGKILVIGGSPTIPTAATNTCEIITPNGNSLLTHLATPMQYARHYHNATILPTGSIFVNGGTTVDDFASKSVYAAEMFNPINQTWTTLAPAKISRRYHQVALLLPDGTVWVAGTTTGSPPGVLRTEIFIPPYVRATRPTISANPTITGGYGGSIRIPTPDAANISAVSLVRVSSVTHHFSSDQRLIWLQIQSSDSGSVTVAAPINSNLAPAGYYMIFVLDNNSVPSIAKFIKIPS